MKKLELVSLFEKKHKELEMALQGDDIEYIVSA